MNLGRTLGLNRSAILRRMGFAAVILLLATIFIWFFSLELGVPGFALDWQMFWAATHEFDIDYSVGWIFNPPWALALLWPISLFSLETSLGLACLVVTWLVLSREEFA